MVSWALAVGVGETGWFWMGSLIYLVVDLQTGVHIIESCVFFFPELVLVHSYGEYLRVPKSSRKGQISMRKDV